MFLFSHKAADFTFHIFTADTKRRKVESKVEIIGPRLYNPNQKNGVTKCKYYQRFNLQANKYVFQFEFNHEKDNFY